jgi:hypothetical protein
MQENKNVYRVLFGKSEGQNSFDRPRRKWENDIKMDFNEEGWGDVDWIHLAQGRKHHKILVNTVKNFWVSP